jgi:hypothetical protein
MTGKIDFYKRNNRSMLADRGLLSLSKDGKIESSYTIDHRENTLPDVEGTTKSK